MALVYSFTNKTNQKMYIGMTTRTIDERIKSHIYEAYNPSSLVYDTPFKRAIRKYGMEGFEVEVLYDGLTRDEAIKLEKELILKHQTYYKYKNSNGYNATIGGENISTPKDKVVQLTETGELVNTFSSVHEAECIYGRGIREHCSNIFKRGKPFGYYWLYEKDYLNFNSQVEVEHFIRYNRTRSVVQLTKEGDYIKMWDSIGEASAQTGLSIGNISSVCSKNRCSTGDYVFMYYQDYYDNGFLPKENNQDRSKKVLQFSKDGALIGKFDSLKDASELTGSSLSGISNVCNGKRQYCNNYIWRFSNEK